MARMNATIMAIAPSHLIGESVGRQPTPRPTAITSAVASRMRARLATMCPASTDEAWIGSERNRSTIPLLLSGANRAARAAAPPVCAAPHHDGVGARPESGAEHDQAGNHVVDVLPAGVEVAAEDVDEQQHQNDGKHQGGEERLRVPQRAAHGAGDHHAGVAEGVGGGHRMLAFSSVRLLSVRDMNTSSRLGRSTDSRAAGAPASWSWPSSR